MATSLYTERIFKRHNTYGGKIDIEDFNTNLPNKRRNINQRDDEAFDASLLDKIKIAKEIQKYKNMTLEELKELRVVSNTEGKPSPTLTDKKWQTEFELRKLFVKPYSSNVKRFGGMYSRESGYWNTDSQTYHGCTNWQSYCSYINDVLNNIRAGQTDYCYFIFQILDLLKFHHDNLRTKYCDGYWEVWLER